MTVSPIPLPDLLRIADDQDSLVHPRSIIHFLYPPLEHWMPHEPLEKHVIPVMQQVQFQGGRHGRCLWIEKCRTYRQS